MSFLSIVWSPFTPGHKWDTISLARVSCAYHGEMVIVLALAWAAFCFACDPHMFVRYPHAYHVMSGLDGDPLHWSILPGVAASLGALGLLMVAAGWGRRKVSMGLRMAGLAMGALYFAADGCSHLASWDRSICGGLLITLSMHAFLIILRFPSVPGGKEWV